MKQNSSENPNIPTFIFKKGQVNKLKTCNIEIY